MAAKKTSKKSSTSRSKRPAAAKSSITKVASRKSAARKVSKSPVASRKTESGATIRSTQRVASKSSKKTSGKPSLGRKPQTSKGVIASATETVRNLVSDVAAGAIRGATEVVTKASDLVTESYQRSGVARGRNKKR